MLKAQPPQPRPIQVGLISLGCAKNLADAEIMLGAILENGMEVTNDPAKADAVIVNTCSFIDSAQEESVDTILESAQIRERGNANQALIVAGCLPQRYREELPKLLPEVDAFIGVDQVAEIPALITQALARRGERGVNKSKLRGRSRKQLKRSAESAPGNRSRSNLRDAARDGSAALVEVHARPRFIPDYATPRFRLTPSHFAYVKIAEGCNHPCSFCIIPRMRGGHRSRHQDDIVAEAKQLVAAGVKELNLISQDSTYYGLDLRPRREGSIAAPDRFKSAARSLPADAPSLPKLLRALNDLDGDFWIRLLYTHPAHWTEELICAIAECPKVARYVDMPLQHIHDVMLERMRRETSGQYIADLIGRIRKGIPGIALRTTFIVGFPGETEAYFESLLEFIRQTRFERLGVFTYSREAGTKAAGMQDHLSAAAKAVRRDRAMAEQLKVAREISASLVGRTMRILVEREIQGDAISEFDIRSWEHGLIREANRAPRLKAARFLVGRGEADAPDIDGRIYVQGSLPAGQFATVRIVGHSDYDLIAVPEN